MSIKSVFNAHKYKHQCKSNLINKNLILPKKLLITTICIICLQIMNEIQFITDKLFKKKQTAKTVTVDFDE